MDIRPFSFDVAEEQLTDLRRRITATKWPEREVDPSQGVQLDVDPGAGALLGHRLRLARLRGALRGAAALRHRDRRGRHPLHPRALGARGRPAAHRHARVAGIDGRAAEDHRPAHPAHGTRASASDAFHLVIPSLPGHGFSGKPTETGWDPIRIARAWVELMTRLGYTRYVAQGGDWGNAVTEQLALLKPPGLLGIHTNMPATVPPDVSRALAIGGPAPAGLSAEEQTAYDVLDHFFKTGVGYANEMANRPQTLYGIADSPVGLAAWMLDHDVRSYELIARAFVGEPGGLSRDDVLDNVTHYWLTNTAISAARLYWESKLAFFDAKGVEIPVGVTVFPDELYPAPLSWAERAYPKLIHYNKVDEGGHFAAWEQPQTFSAEMRSTFRSLR